MKKWGPEHGLVDKVGVETHWQRPSLVLTPKAVVPRDTVAVLLHYSHLTCQEGSSSYMQVRLIFTSLWQD